MPTLFTRPQFAARIKEKFPEYKDWDDAKLVDRIIEKHPEYKDKVETKDQAFSRATSLVMGDPLSSSKSIKKGLFQGLQSTQHLKETNPDLYKLRGEAYEATTRPLNRKATSLKVGTASSLIDLINFGKGLSVLGIDSGGESNEQLKREEAISTASHKGYVPTGRARGTPLPQGDVEKKLLDYLSQPNVKEALQDPSALEYLLNKAPQLGGMMARLGVESTFFGPAAPFFDTFISTYQQPLGERVKQQAFVGATLGLGKVAKGAVGKVVKGNSSLPVRALGNVAVRSSQAASLYALTRAGGGTKEQATEQGLFGLAMPVGKFEGSKATPEPLKVEEPPPPPNFKGTTKNPVETERALTGGKLVSEYPGQIEVSPDRAAKHLESLQALTKTTSFKKMSSYHKNLITEEISRLKDEIPPPSESTERPQYTKGSMAARLSDIAFGTRDQSLEEGSTKLLPGKSTISISTNLPSGEQTPEAFPAEKTTDPLGPPLPSQRTTLEGREIIPTRRPGQRGQDAKAKKKTASEELSALTNSTSQPPKEPSIDFLTKGAPNANEPKSPSGRANPRVPQRGNLSKDEAQVRQEESGPPSRGSSNEQQTPPQEGQTKGGQEKGSIDPSLLGIPQVNHLINSVGSKISSFVSKKSTPKPEMSEALPDPPGQGPSFKDFSPAEALTSSLKTQSKVLYDNPATRPAIEVLSRANDSRQAWVGTRFREAAGILKGLSLSDSRLAGELLDTTGSPSDIQAKASQSSPRFKTPYTPESVRVASELRSYMDSIHQMFPPKSGPQGKNVGYIQAYLTHMESLVGDSDLSRGIHQLWDYHFRTPFRNILTFWEKPDLDMSQGGGSFDKFTRDPSSPYVRQRRGGIKDLEYDVRRIIPAYTESAAKVIWDRPALQQAKDMAQSLPLGSALRESLSWTIKHMSRYDAYPQLEQGWRNLSDGLTKMYARSVLAFNPVIAGYHAFRLLPDVWPHIETKYLAKGLKEYTKSPLKTMQESARLGLVAPDVRPWKFKSVGERMDSVMQLFNVGDYFSRTVGFQAFKAKYLDEGLSPQEATLKALTRTKDLTQFIDPLRNQKVFNPEGPVGLLGKSLLQFKQQPAMIVEQYWDVFRNMGRDPVAATKLAGSLALGLGIVSATGFRAIHLSPSMLHLGGGAFGEIGNIGFNLTNAYKAYSSGDDEKAQQYLEQVAADLIKDVVPGGRSIPRQIRQGRPGFLEPPPSPPKVLRPRAPRATKSFSDMLTH